MLRKNDFLKYFNEHKSYKPFIQNLFWYQKFKDASWTKGENFGDYLSKVIIGEIAKNLNLKKSKNIDNKLLAVGSILHFAKDNDIVWGSGINGKISLEKLQFRNLKIKAVRGPLTKEILEKRGLVIPEVFGDPALLMPQLFPNLKYKPIKNKITIIPNLNEYIACKKIISKSYNIISPLKHWSIIFDEILTSELVYTSSLHGLIVCEAFNVPIRLFKPFGGETMFKYEDYLEGTNRKLTKIPKSLNQSLNENNGAYFDPPIFDSIKMINQFPKELFLKDLNDK